MTTSDEIPKMMKALMKNKETESYDYTEVPVPEPTGDEILIKVDTVSICGSDIAMYTWNSIASLIATIPFIPGHECAGTVIKCGPDAKDIPVGAKVGVENHFYCGDCYQCNNGLREICMNMGQYGHGRKTPHGGCSEYSIVSQKYLYTVTQNLTSEEIAMMEPMGVAHNGIERLEVEGEDVVVIGCGAVGLLAQSIAKAMGAKRVIGCDIEDWKLKLAKEIGTDIVINTKERDLKEAILELTDGVGVGRICECSGVASMLNSCFPYLRKGGRLVLIGLPKQPFHVDNVLQDIVFKCLTIKTVHGRRIWHEWESTERLIGQKKVDVTKVISHRYPMSQYEEAFKMLMSGAACKITMDPSK